MSIDFLKILENFPESLDIKEVREATPYQIFHLHTHYKNEEWKLKILINPYSFPFELPTIYIDNIEDYAPMGHVNWDGHICYKDKQGLVIDFRKPENVLIACIYEALRTVSENNSDTHKRDLHNDFKSYWESIQSSHIKTICIVSPSETTKELIAYYHAKNKTKSEFPSYFFMIESEHELNHNYILLDYTKFKEVKHDRAIYIPLEKRVNPPNHKKTWAVKDVVDIFNTHTSNLVQEQAKEILSKQKWSNSFSVIFSHPKLDSGHNLWGIQFNRKEKAQHPFINPQVNWTISPIHLQLHNKEYLFERTSNSIFLNDKKVAVIGCGSVGGVVAFQLAKAGVGELHLFDPDVMETENIYRHILGGSALSSYKILNLKWYIENNIPYTRVITPEIKEIDKYTLNMFIQKKLFDLYDAIVVATGDFTSELNFNSVHKKLSKPIPVIYTWQDGFGIGGHAICVVNDGSKGCLECLYTTSNGFELHPKTSFIKQGQTISKHLGGCSGIFTPFSFLDASQTALLATKMTLEALQGKIKNEIRSWKGSDEQLKAAGYSASIWYDKSPQYFIQDEKNYIAHNCKICGKNH